MSRRRNAALGAATGLLVASYVVAALRFAPGVSVVTPNRTVLIASPRESTTRVGLTAAVALTVGLAVAYGRFIAGRNDLGSARRRTWLLSFVVGAPISMPLYFLRHVRQHRR